MEENNREVVITFCDLLERRQTFTNISTDSCPVIFLYTNSLTDWSI